MSMKTLKLSPYDILFLSEIKGLGLNRIQSIIKNDLTISELSKFKAIDWSFIKGISADKLFFDFQSKLKDKELDRRISKTLSVSDSLIFYWDDDYPELLRRVYSPPAYLSCKGNHNLLDHEQVAIVGTRNPTSYGRKSCELFTSQLARKGKTISSGMAKGIDAIAHQTALNNSAKTIAVLGSGIETIYPAVNRNLYFSILREDGLIISEHLFDAKPDAVNFPMRNRIIAGIVESTIVIEAGIKSGAVITANIANELGKSVYAVPGSIFSAQSEGCNLLLQEGAYVLTQEEDYLVQSHEIKTRSNESLDLSDLSSPESKIIHALKDGPRHIDQLSNNLKLSASELLSSLLNLELKSLVQEVNAKVYEIQF